MTDHSVPPNVRTPNDYERIRAGGGFYRGNAVFPSYFTIFRRKSEHFTTGLEAVFPPHQTAITGRFSYSAPRMAIV
jgi:hypothetical protein